jgi:hypothetical protein
MVDRTVASTERDHSIWHIILILILILILTQMISCTESRRDATRRVGFLSLELFTFPAVNGFDSGLILGLCLVLTLKSLSLE